MVAKGEPEIPVPQPLPDANRWGRGQGGYSGNKYGGIFWSACAMELWRNEDMKSELLVYLVHL